MVRVLCQRQRRVTGTGGSIDLQYVPTGLGYCSVDLGCVAEFWVGGY